ncbi:MAG: hypothetical protein ACI4WR_00870 [Bulleidia sp.]
MKTSESEVRGRISPYVHGSFHSGPYVNESDLHRIAEVLKGYSDVSVSVGKNILNDGHLDCIICISQFLSDRKLRYEIRPHGIRKTYYDPLSWIDEIEGWDAFLD